MIAPQHIALAEWLPAPGLKDAAVCAAADEAGKQLGYTRMEIHDAIGVWRFWSLSIASPHGLLDAESCAVEMPDLQPKQFAGPKTRRGREDEKDPHFIFGHRNDLSHLLRAERGGVLSPRVNEGARR